MSDEELEEVEAVPEPGWKERLAAVRRAGRALFETRAAIFREEIAEKGSFLGRAALGFSLAAAFAVLALLVLTAFVAAVLSRWLGGPIAGLAATLFLYALIVAGTGLFGMKSFARVRPFEFPITRDELRKDFEAVSAKEPAADEESASPEALAAERASVHPREPRDEQERIDDRGSPEPESLEERFRAGSE